MDIGQHDWAMGDEEAFAFCDMEEIPLLGVVAAGEPYHAFAVDETLSVPTTLWGGKSVFALRVQGNSMIDEGIHNGDYLIVEPRATADNGQTVPMKVAVEGPFAPGPRVTAIHLFSEANPVPDMAVFEFPVAVEQVEIESRIRLATSQRIVAVAAMSDGTLWAAAAEVIVTIAGCMDGT